ncbi:MAG: right-handed parallel beta-helix repeat-containing protein [Tannerella sp.]|jgi:hypothetical protein|nr:right-handed parallel beta-helix repeat-containing protein [Tannerella sp.]
MKYIFIFFILVVSSGAMTLRADAYPDLKPVLDAQKGNAVINIPKGTYLLDLQRYGAYTFDGLTGVEVKGNGSEIICNDQQQAFSIKNCRNFKLSDISIDYDPLCFTQGVITEIDPARKWFTITMDEGYPLENITTERVQFFDPQTRTLRKNSITTYANNYTSLEKVSGAAFKLTKNGNWDALEQLGDLVTLSVVSANKQISHTIYLYRNTNLVMEDVTVYGSNSFSILEMECNNSRYSRCKIIPKPDEPQRPSPRLRSGNADGLHSKQALKGPTIENCEITFCADDCIAINGAFYPVYKVDNTNLDANCNSSDKTVRHIYLLGTNTSFKQGAGDTLQLVSYDGALLGTAHIDFVRTQDDTEAPTPGEISACMSKFPDLSNAGQYKYGVRYRISEIPEGVNINTGDLVYNKQGIGSGFAIRNNKIGYNRSRGILVKASDGIITGNEITETAMNGIILSPELNWMEAGCSENVEISNNVLLNCMYERTNAGMRPGALAVVGINGKREVSPAGMFHNITIRNNTIEGGPRPAIALTSIDGVNGYDNLITPDEEMIREHGSRFGADNTLDVWTKNVINAHLPE